MILTKKSRRLFYTYFQEVVILKIYLDILFLENFLMDYILLLLTGKILQKQSRRPRLIAAAAIGGGYTVLYYFFLGMSDPGQGEWIRFFFQIGNLIASYGMIRLAYASSTGRGGIVCLITIWLLSFATGGILTWIQEAVPAIARQRSPDSLCQKRNCAFPGITTFNTISSSSSFL